MRPDVAARVQTSWASLRGREERVVERFYARLFELDPGLRRLFVVTDMEMQRRKFADTLGLMVRWLDDPTGLAREARRSGARHADYGVRRADYRSGGEALLWALERELGDAFTDEVRAAWAEAYTVLAHEMSRGASAPVG